MPVVHAPQPPQRTKIDGLIRRLKRMCEKEGIFRQLRQTRHIKKTEENKLKKKEAVKRNRKQAAMSKRRPKARY